MLALVLGLGAMTASGALGTLLFEFQPDNRAVTTATTDSVRYANKCDVALRAARDAYLSSDRERMAQAQETLRALIDPDHTAVGELLTTMTAVLSAEMEVLDLQRRIRDALDDEKVFLAEELHGRALRVYPALPSNVSPGWVNVSPSLNDAGKLPALSERIVLELPPATLYREAEELVAANRAEDAVVRLVRLVEQYPDSMKVDDARKMLDAYYAEMEEEVREIFAENLTLAKQRCVRYAELFGTVEPYITGFSDLHQEMTGEQLDLNRGERLVQAVEAARGG